MMAQQLSIVWFQSLYYLSDSCDQPTAYLHLTDEEGSEDGIEYTLFVEI
jgi:hypothetical protein